MINLGIEGVMLLAAFFIIVALIVVARYVQPGR
jgi:ABC-type uncharacterized transport system permease subunit